MTYEEEIKTLTLKQLEHQIIGSDKGEMTCHGIKDVRMLSACYREAASRGLKVSCKLHLVKDN